MTDRRPILFALPYPGHLRYFDSVLAELAARGHHVQLWFAQPSKQPEGLRAVQGMAGVEVRGTLPRRRGSSRDVALAVRTVADFVRYLDPRFAAADYLRDRAGRKLPGRWQRLRRLPMLPTWLVRQLLRASLALERSIPTVELLDALIARERPILVVAAPGVMSPSTSSADLLKSAQAAGIPTVGAVSSWDNLTTKGMFRVTTDRVLVWNEAIAEEAVELHLLPRERVGVTGAQPFDRWFGREPRHSLPEFAQRVGLPGEQPYLLFVGSTASISEPDAEVRFVLAWLQAIRASGGSLREVPVLVRPHPYNHAHWPDVELSSFGSVVLWPPHRPNPVDDDDRADYFDSIHHALAVVGINTSAMIEAAIQRKPVFSVALPEFRASQGGTLHFGYLLPENGGFVRTATSIDEHLRQLEATLQDPEEARGEIDAFLLRFARPRGLDRPCTPIFVDQLEEVLSSRAAAPIQSGLLTRLIAGVALRTVFAGPSRTRALRSWVGAFRRRASRALRWTSSLSNE